LEDLHRVGTEERFILLGDFSNHGFSGSGVANEHHSTVG
jgi:hypothetical protein